MTNGFLKFVLICFGIRVQSPVRRVNIARSLKYRTVCKLLSNKKGSGKKKVAKKGRKIKFSFS